MRKGPMINLESLSMALSVGAKTVKNGLPSATASLTRERGKGGGFIKRKSMCGVQWNSLPCATAPLQRQEHRVCPPCRDLIRALSVVQGCRGATGPARLHAGALCMVVLDWQALPSSPWYRCTGFSADARGSPQSPSQCRYSRNVLPGTVDHDVRLVCVGEGLQE